MTDWRAASGPEVAISRAAMLQRLRAYFDAESVLEVDNPGLFVEVEICLGELGGMIFIAKDHCVR